MFIGSVASCLKTGTSRVAIIAASSGVLFAATPFQADVLGSQRRVAPLDGTEESQVRVNSAALRGSATLSSPEDGAIEPQSDFDPAAPHRVFSLMNTGSQALSWAAKSSVSWIAFS